MEIRKAKVSDLDQINTLIESLESFRRSIFVPENKEFHEKSLGEEKFSSSTSEIISQSSSELRAENLADDIFFVALVEKQIIGFISGSIHKRSQSTLQNLGSVDQLFVLEKFRKKQIAEKLFASLGTEFKKLGCDHLTTHTDFENETAQSFYKSVKMSPVTVEFWKNL